ncbi:MAG: HNH endonuclease [Hyphomonas sp.]|uniref:HNH endonuclease n=1 Tax=Hyphomonas sp. TaxID=87 RepID=UPI001798BB66|nr:HNH endonuclease [Hyphomonas sp.]MBA3068122.1 HNH endonuclease [Hyphomonas sp.]MBU3922065.1 HNH endonuclease [Alphaproteobacteria bacterium]MBU4061143.1 HNH endonuclease [Alphaproteobacteria bacterium]MBU4162867.1 HNH endonuclease [Alphaproteobacteria bacterium]
MGVVSESTDLDGPPFENVRPGRKLKPYLQTVIWSRSAGRCALCNKDVTESELTLRPGTKAEKAHIVAYSKGGQRGSESDRPSDINAIENLILLCQPCHADIDAPGNGFTSKQLRQIKNDHEGRIRRLAELSPENKSHVIAFTSPIGSLAVSIQKGHAFQAMLPRYPIDREWTFIDLTGNTGQAETADFLQVAKERIKREIRIASDAHGPVQRAQHISLFAIGPIPQLIYLGTRLSDKLPLDVFQRHRAPETWAWKSPEDHPPVAYEFRTLKSAGPSAPPALILSLSGRIHIGDLPVSIQTSHAIYELTLKDATPTPTFLNAKRDADAFRNAYHDAQSFIADVHGNGNPLSLFPAVPAPLAVLIGRERLRKIRFAFDVYENDKAKGGFTKQLEISNDDTD